MRIDRRAVVDKSNINQILTQLRLTSDAISGSLKPDNAQFNPKEADFSNILKSAVDQVNATQQTAGQLSQEFMKGGSDTNLHDVMISLQKANISFQSMIQIRNRLVTAYQEIMNMQV